MRLKLIEGGCALGCIGGSNARNFSETTRSIEETKTDVECKVKFRVVWTIGGSEKKVTPLAGVRNGVDRDGVNEDGVERKSI